MNLRTSALTLASALLLASCGSDSKPAPAGLLSSSPTTSSASATPRASATTAPSNTPAPTSNPKPTDTPQLAATAALAAATQVPATAIPATPVPATATTKPAPPAVPPTVAAVVRYANCAAVRAAGKAPLYRGQPGYSSALDRDRDGIACE